MAPLTNYVPIAEAIAKLFYPLVEVVIHNIEENRVEAIFNSFSGRRVGDDSLIDNAEALAKGPDVLGPFEKRSHDNRRQKYVTVLLKKQRKAVGLMCINFDMSVAEKVQETVQLILGPTEDSTQVDALFRHDLQDRITTFVHEHLQARNVSLSKLLPTDRRELVRALWEAGAFEAKRATSFAAQVLGVSRATIYNDLAEVRGENET